MIIATEELSEQQKKDIWQLLNEADCEFVPPLSARKGTTQKNLIDVEEGKVPTEYFEGLMQQSFILCISDSHVVGFMSFIKDHELKLYGDNSIVCDYIYTIIVNKSFRNKGYTTGMYKKLFDGRSEKNYATRTWSTNRAHLHVLDKIGFELVYIIKDDRGNGIDTVYYVKNS